MACMKEQEIVLLQKDVKYPGREMTFGPSKIYPEYPFGRETISNLENNVYEMVRDGFIMMGLDKEHVGTAEWNPLGEIIHHGDYVLLKPNMVLHENHIKENGTECLITHPSIVRAVLDFVVIALHGTGHIVVGDAPLQSCDFDKLIQEQGYLEIVEFYHKRGIEIELRDFRLVKSQVNHGIVHVIDKKENGDCVAVNIGELSEHQDDGYDRLRVTNYNPDEMQIHHNKAVHEYLIAGPILSADVIINLPKPKTHRKAGLTGALKNLVGINGNKDWLPHHKKGSVYSGGDEYKNRNIFKSLEANLLDFTNRKANRGAVYAQFLRILRSGCFVLGKLTASDQYHEGSWYGNDTIWRTIVDLNRILLYCDKKGIIQREKQRRIFIIGDMIVSGEGEGPLMPSPVEKGILLFGWNPVAFDTVAADIMGFDYQKIPSICKSYNLGKYPLIDFDKKDIVVREDCNNKFSSIKRCFVPSSGWKGHIEK